jgi:hypothetical protein
MTEETTTEKYEYKSFSERDATDAEEPKNGDVGEKEGGEAEPREAEVADSPDLADEAKAEPEGEGG